MRSSIRRFWKSEDGAAAVEYGLLLALIATAIIGVVRILGTTLSSKFDDVASVLQG